MFADKSAIAGYALGYADPGRVTGATMDTLRFASTLLAALVGLLAGSLITWQIMRKQSARRYARLVAAAREQLVASTQNLRVANGRLQADLQNEQAAAHDRQVAFVAKQRESVLRLEGQLRFAYGEIDRLRMAAGHGSAASGGAVPDDPHGFAVTRPYER